ncbi:MAG: porin family protein [Sediminibacterium sp.]
MKKINTLILFCLLTMMSFAQATKTTTTNKYRLGFKVSPNVSWLASDNSSMTVGDKSLQFGYGLNFDIFFADHYAIGTGFNINNTGGKYSYFAQYTGEDLDAAGTVLTNMKQVGLISRDLRLQYLQIPLTFKMKTDEIGLITYWGQFGLGLNMNLKALSADNIDYLYYQNKNTLAWEKSNRVNSSMSGSKDIKNEVNIFSSNLIFAAGIEYSLSGNTSILAGLTFQNGFTDALKGTGVAKDASTNSPVFDGGTSNAPETFELSGLPNYIELNIGILF